MSDSYCYVIGPCISCGTVFCYHPHHVPSTRAFTGEREPVCASCMDALNAKAKADGLEPFQVPPDAYEPCPEEEL
jgi:hypothetical protein